MTYELAHTSLKIGRSYWKPTEHRGRSVPMYYSCEHAEPALCDYGWVDKCQICNTN